MDISMGSIVRAKAGRDKGSYFIAVSLYENYAYICDGKRRKIEHPKKKKLIHLEVTGTIVGDFTTNRKIKKALNEFKAESRI